MDRRIYNNYVLKVAEYGSLTKAAAVLGVTQPALSSGLNGLEKELGYTIFHRRTTPITFTPEGKLYYEYVQRLQTMEADLSLRVENLHKDLDRSVSIGAPAAYVATTVANAVSRLLQDNPECKAEIKSAPLNELISLAETGKVHCFISTTRQLPGNFETRLVRKEQLFMCVPKSFSVNALLKERWNTSPENGKQLDLSLLDEEPFIFLEDSQPLQIQAKQFFSIFRIRPKNSIVVDQVSSALIFAGKGHGICFASDESLNAYANPNAISVYPLPASLCGREIFVAYDRNLFMPKACQKLIDLLCGEE